MAIYALPASYEFRDKLPTTLVGKVAFKKLEDEDVLSYALFPGVATEFFKYRQAEKYGIESDFTDFENKVTIV